MSQLRSEAVEAKEQSDKALASKVWKGALSRSREALVTMKSEIDAFLLGLPAIATPLREELPSLAESARRLLALNESNQENPVLQKALFMRGMLVELSLRRQMRPLESLQSVAARMNDSLQQVKQGQILPFRTQPYF